MVPLLRNSSACLRKVSSGDSDCVRQALSCCSCASSAEVYGPGTLVHYEQPRVPTSVPIKEEESTCMCTGAPEHDEQIVRLGCERARSEDVKTVSGYNISRKPWCTVTGPCHGA